MLIAQPSNTSGPFSFDRGPPFELEAELAKEIDRTSEVFDDDSYVVHPLERHVPSVGSELSLVAFPLPLGTAIDVSIEFLFRSGAQRIRLAVQNPAVFTGAATAPTLVDQFRAKLAAHTDPIRDRAVATKSEIDRKLNPSGCLGILVLGGIILLLIALLK
jgi:hypothetical protein